MLRDGVVSDPTPRRARLRWVALAIGLTAALSVPALWTPFDPDEHLVLGGIEGSPWMGTGGDLYRFSTGRPEDVRSLVERGAVPWFTSPEWKYALWRPLTSALFLVDRCLSGWNRLGYQVHSLLWSLSLVAVCGLLLRRLLPAVPAAAALLVFAASVFHAEPAGWLTARHVLVSSVIAFSAVLCHVRWRQDGWRAGSLLSVLLLAAALLASEAALQSVGYLVAFEALGNRAPWRERVRGLLACAVVLLVYCVVYRALDRGTNEGLGYVDPFAQPAFFLLRGWDLLGRLLTRLTTQLDPEPWAKVVLIPAVWVVFRAVARLPESERRTTAWLGVGSVLSLLPVLGGYWEDRVLLVPSVGVSVLVVATARLVCAMLKEPRSLLRPKELLLVVLCGMVCLVHAAGPVRLSLRFVELGRLAERQMDAIHGVQIDRDPAPDVIVINSTNWAVGLHGGYIQGRERGTRPRPWIMLSMTGAEHEVRRICARTFELSLADGRPFDVRWFRDPVRHPMRVGEVVVQCGVRVRVAEVANGWPTRLEVSLDRCLEDRSLQFFSMQGGSLRRIAMPGLGGVVRIACAGP